MEYTNESELRATYYPPIAGNALFVYIFGTHFDSVLCISPCCSLNIISTLRKQLRVIQKISKMNISTPNHSDETTRNGKRGSHEIIQLPTFSRYGVFSKRPRLELIYATQPTTGTFRDMPRQINNNNCTSVKLPFAAGPGATTIIEIDTSHHKTRVKLHTKVNLVFTQFVVVSMVLN